MKYHFQHNIHHHNIVHKLHIIVNKAMLLDLLHILCKVSELVAEQQLIQDLMCNSEMMTLTCHRVKIGLHCTPTPKHIPTLSKRNVCQN